MRLAPLPLFAALLLAPLPSCETYDSPPRVSIDGLVEGMLPDPTKPVVLRFSEAVDPATVRVKLAMYETDAEGNLGDEDADPATELKILAQHPTPPVDPEAEEDTPVGSSRVLDDGLSVELTPASTPPTGPSLVLIVEPGLADRDGNATTARKKLVFGYRFTCSGEKGTAIFESGSYFLLVDVDKPIGTQIQLVAKIEIDPKTGAFLGQFTNADRNRKPPGCSQECKATEACRTLPSASCVTPSERAGTIEEYPDWQPNNEPPTGYSFTATGCVEDQTATQAAFVNAPVDASVQIPAITIKGIRMTASFERDATGTIRATGSFTADQVIIGTTPSGAGTGSMTMRRIPDDAIPNIPAPP